MMKNKLLIIGILFIGIGVYYSGNSYFPIFPNNKISESLSIKKPNDELLKLIQPVIESLKNGNSDRKEDGLRLARLYKDMSLLITVDNSILKTTESIREANVLSAKILQIDMKGKYEGLADAANTLFKKYVSPNSVMLDDELRQKSSEAFLALAWGFLEGSK